MSFLNYEHTVSRIIVYKSSVVYDFFILSTQMAGEILQKYHNYHIKMAIVGEYSGYTSKPRKDFIYESNKGNDFFFVATIEEAVELLGNAREW